MQKNRRCSSKRDIRWEDKTNGYISHPLTKSIDNMKWVKELEEQCKVDVEWEQVYTDWETVKSTRFVSGDIPDLLFNATIDSDYTTYHGLFQDLTDLIEKDAPNIQSMFLEEPNTKVLVTTKEGQTNTVIGAVKG